MRTNRGWQGVEEYLSPSTAARLAVRLLIVEIAARPCEASAFHDIAEDGVSRCLDPEYCEANDPETGAPIEALIGCDPCRFRAAIR